MSISILSPDTWTTFQNIMIIREYFMLLQVNKMVYGYTLMRPMLVALSYVQNFAVGFKEWSSLIPSPSIQANGSWSILIVQPCGMSKVIIKIIIGKYLEKRRFNDLDFDIYYQGHYPEYPLKGFRRRSLLYLLKSYKQKNFYELYNIFGYYIS